VAATCRLLPLPLLPLLLPEGLLQLLLYLLCKRAPAFLLLVALSAAAAAAAAAASAAAPAIVAAVQPLQLLLLLPLLLWLLLLSPWPAGCSCWLAAPAAVDKILHHCCYCHSCCDMAQ